jgi:two-component system probable response regulator PhcQ
MNEGTHMPSDPSLPRSAILYVDDEASSLKYFPRLYGDAYTCLVASSVAEARALIEAQPERIGVVLTDQRMPGETGVDLLAWLRQRHPGIVRLLTTAYADLDSAIAAVNSGAIFRYVIKPWHEMELRGVLKQSMDFHILQKERDALIREKLSALQRLVMMDRVRSFAVLAAGLANRIKNPLIALKAFLDHAPEAPAAPSGKEGGQVQWSDLWRVAQQEGQQILGLVQHVVESTLAGDGGMVAASLCHPADLLGESLAIAQERLHAQATLAVPAGVPSLLVDRAMVSRLFEILTRRLLALDPDLPGLAFSAESAELRGRPAVRVRMVSAGLAWDQARIATLFAVLAPPSGQPPVGDGDLLAAYFIAYHHGGDIRIHTQAPHGPGFEVLLPLDSSQIGSEQVEADWIETIFSFPL